MTKVINESKKKVLLICGSLNQTTMIYQISQNLINTECYFTPFYADGYINELAKIGFLDFTILGGSFKESTVNFLKDKNVQIDYKGTQNNYDLVITCSDLIVPKNIRNKRLVLVQEGMTDPKNFAFYLVKWFNLPRYFASTSTNGLSDKYDFFCVASEGYKDLFVKNGVNSDKIIITGIPNFDDCNKYKNNDFPYHDFVLAATSDSRETLKYENRKKFIYKCKNIAGSRQLIFKLHPNEWVDRATNEINKYAPGALVFSSGNVHEMIANCETLITRYSTVVYTGIALGKEVFSEFDLTKLKRLTPIQNGGQSAANIASVCCELLEKDKERKRFKFSGDYLFKKKQKFFQNIEKFGIKNQLVNE